MSTIVTLYDHRGYRSADLLDITRMADRLSRQARCLPLKLLSCLLMIDTYNGLSASKSIMKLGLVQQLSGLGI